MGQFLDARRRREQKHLVSYRVRIIWNPEDHKALEAAIIDAAATHAVHWEADLRDGRRSGVAEHIARGADRADIVRYLQSKGFEVTTEPLRREDRGVVYIAARGGTEKRCGCPGSVPVNRCPTPNEDLPPSAWRFSEDRDGARV